MRPYKYAETVLVPAGQWVEVRHGLGSHVTVTVYDEAGDVLWPTMNHTDRNSLSFTLGHPTAYQQDDGSVEVGWSDAPDDVRVTVVVEA